MEKPVVFKSQGQQIIGVVHMPERRKGKVPAVVFFHGFTGTKVEPHRIFVKMARALARAGIAALRFDFRGSGDSEGDFSKMTISGELQDAAEALRFVRRLPGVDPKRVGVLGLSMGGAVAAMTLGRDLKIPGAALWSPVANLGDSKRRKMKPGDREQLRQMGVIDHGGNAVGRGFLDDMPRHNPLKAIVGTRAAVLIVHGDQDETVPIAAAHAYEKALKRAKKAVAKHIVTGADHTYNSLAWETQVVGLTLEWFRCVLGGVA